MSSFPLSVGRRLRTDWPTVTPTHPPTPAEDGRPGDPALCCVCNQPCAASNKEAADRVRRAPDRWLEHCLVRACYRSEALRAHLVATLFGPDRMAVPVLRRVMACLFTGREFRASNLCPECWWPLLMLLDDPFCHAESVDRDVSRYVVAKLRRASAAEAFAWAAEMLGGDEGEHANPYVVLVEVARALGVSRERDETASALHWALIERMAGEVAA